MGTPGLLPTTLVGSYPQRHWLINRERLASDCRRVCAPRRSGAFPNRCSIEQAQDDATLLALRDFELAGIEIVTGGEIRRERQALVAGARMVRAEFEGVSGV